MVQLFHVEIDEKSMATIDEKISAIEKKLIQLKTQKQQVEARQKMLEKKKLRADDTRRKILVGSTILAKVSKSEFSQSQLTEMMDAALTRNDDRALFGLPPITEKNKNIEMNIQPTLNNASI